MALGGHNAPHAGSSPDLWPVAAAIVAVAAARPALPAAGGRAGGSVRGHRGRPVPAAAAGRLVADRLGGLVPLGGSSGGADGSAPRWPRSCWRPRPRPPRGTMPAGFCFAADDLGQFARDATQPVCVEVRALKMPRLVPHADADPMSFVRAGDVVRMDVEVLAVRDGAEWRPAGGRCRLSVDGLLPGIEAGDRLRVFGHLTAPAAGAEPGRIRRGRVRPRRPRPQPSPGQVQRVGHAPGAGQSVEPLAMAGQGPQRRQSALGQVPRPRRIPPWRPRCCWAPASNSSPTASSPSWRRARSTCWSLPACTWASWPGPCSCWPGGCRSRGAGRCWAWRAFAVLYMLLVDAQPPVVRATVMVVVMCGAAYLGRRPLGVQLAGRGGAGGAGRQSRRTVSRRRAVVVSLRGGPDVVRAAVDTLRRKARSAGATDLGEPRPVSAHGAGRSVVTAGVCWRSA